VCCRETYLVIGFAGRSESAVKNSKKSVPKKKQLKLAKQATMGKTSRVVVCGMSSVGKTAILEQLIYGNVTTATVNHALSVAVGQGLQGTLSHG